MLCCHRDLGALKAMTFLLVIMLAALWGAVFVPSLLRARRGTSAIGSVGSFRRGMAALRTGAMSGSTGRWVLVPPHTETASAPPLSVHRRRRIFTGLVAAAASSLFFGLVPGLHLVLWAHLVVDVCLIGFCVYLVKIKPVPPVPVDATVFRFELDGETQAQPKLVEEPSDDYLKVGGFGI